MKLRSQKVRDKIWVHWKGRIYDIPADIKKAQRATHGEEEQALVAPFSCKILKIHAKTGQTLRKGDAVIVVEAMKMEYSYSSPRDGVVGRIPVKEGEIVQGGTNFIEWGE